MFKKLFSYIFNWRNINYNEISNIINKIKNLKEEFSIKTNNDLKKNTFKYKEYFLSGKDINIIIPEIFANIIESIKRIFNINLFDVQLISALYLNKGYITDMKTGEGKTITSTLPIYFHSLYNKGVHVITINEYLAKRDSTNNRKLFNFLGLSVGLNLSNLSILEKQDAYLCDITYGTNNEFCFDYLKDNLVLRIEDKVQRKYLFYALLDEIDSILIDEARTPLIISDDILNINNIYTKINSIIHNLKIQNDKLNILGDFIINFKLKNIYLTDKGFLKLENLLLQKGLVKKKSNNFLYKKKNIKLINYIIISLKAHYLYKKNIDYLVINNKIIIIDEFTGRLMPDKKWSDGLHQAIEAKEGISLSSDSKILASITFQNYFRLYEKLSGMSGTAINESCEFKQIYNMDTVVIPTNKPLIRRDYEDIFFTNEKNKIDYIINDIIRRNKLGQPILVGTLTVEKSELISMKLEKLGIKHNVLNAKYHKLESKIISQAGKLNSVTIATNMAGRGTDIILGGNYFSKINFLYKKRFYKDYKILLNKWKLNNKLVKNLGGLHIIGVERNESRRIDDQLRGRAGRQGDPGSSIFYISFEDSLIKMFMSKNILNMIKNIGFNSKFSKNIEDSLINKLIEKAQNEIELRNFEIRKNLLQYDDITNVQRKIIYDKRNDILYSKYINLDYKIIIKEYINKLFNNITKINFSKRIKYIKYVLFLNLNYVIKDKYLSYINYLSLKKIIIKKLIKIYKIKKINYGNKIFNIILKNIMIRLLDNLWQEYIFYIDSLKEYIHLRGYANKDPIQEYKIESYKIFFKILDNFYYELIKILFIIPDNINDLDKFLLDFKFFKTKIKYFN